MGVHFPKSGHVVPHLDFVHGFVDDAYFGLSTIDAGAIDGVLGAGD